MLFFHGAYFKMETFLQCVVICFQSILCILKFQHVYPFKNKNDAHT